MHTATAVAQRTRRSLAYRRLSDTQVRKLYPIGAEFHANLDGKIVKLRIVDYFREERRARKGQLAPVFEHANPIARLADPTRWVAGIDVILVPYVLPQRRRTRLH